MLRTKGETRESRLPGRVGRFPVTVRGQGKTDADGHETVMP